MARWVGASLRRRLTGALSVPLIRRVIFHVRRLRDDLENAVTLLAYAGCITLGVATAVALAPGGEPRSIAVQSALAGGLGIGLLSAQRARPSPTQWALGMGVLGIVAAWQRLG
jgi:hypothetical protein